MRLSCAGSDIWRGGVQLTKGQIMNSQIPTLPFCIFLHLPGFSFDRAEQKEDKGINNIGH